MSLVTFAGGETGVVADEVTNAGGITISSAQAKVGTYSYRMNPVTTGTATASLLGFAATGAGAAFNVANGWVNCWIYIASLPPTEEIILRAANAATRKLEVTITSGGILKVYDSAATLVATGTTALSTGVWYNIGMLAGNGAAATYTIQINGTTELTGTCNQGATNFTRLIFGKFADKNGGGYDIYFDELMLDDAGFNYGKFSALSIPTANGATMQWTSGTGASNYTQLTEVPRDTTTYVMSTGAANDVARFQHQSMATLGISGATIYSVITQIYVRENVATTTATKTRLVSGATTTDGTAIDPGTGIQLLGQIFNTDPNTSAAWTESNLNSAEFGAIETNAVSTRMTWAAMYIIYTPTASFSWKVRAEPNSSGTQTNITQPTIPWTSTINNDFFVEGVYEPDDS